MDLNELVKAAVKAAKTIATASPEERAELPAELVRKADELNQALQELGYGSE